MTDREQNLEERIRHHLEATGERDRLKRLLVKKLESSGWRDLVKEKAQSFADKQGKNVTIEEIVKGVRPQCR